jgi:hypothetical protein
MNSKAKKSFKAQVDDIIRLRPHLDCHLIPIAADERAAGVWELIARHPDRAEKFFGAVFLAKYYSEHPPSKHFEMSLEHIARGLACTTPIENYLKDGAHDWLKDRTVRELLASLDQFRAELENHRLRVMDVRDRNRLVSHKDNPRTVFMKALCHSMELYFDRPHYDLVAAIADILFDAKNSVDADAAKKAYARARRREEQAMKRQFERDHLGCKVCGGAWDGGLFGPKRNP